MFWPAFLEKPQMLAFQKYNYEKSVRIACLFALRLPAKNKKP